MARKPSALRTELKRCGISRQQLCEYRKLAAIPLPEFKEMMEGFKKRGERISFRKLLRGGDDGLREVVQGIAEHDRFDQHHGPIQPGV